MKDKNKKELQEMDLFNPFEKNGNADNVSHMEVEVTKEFEKILQRAGLIKAPRVDDIEIDEMFNKLVGVELLDDKLREEVYTSFKFWYSDLPRDKRTSKIEKLNKISEMLLTMNGAGFCGDDNAVPEKLMQYADDTGKCIWDWVRNFKNPEYVYVMNGFVPVKRKSAEMAPIDYSIMLYDVYTRSISITAVMVDGSREPFLPIHKVAAVVFYEESVQWEVLKAFLESYYARMLDTRANAYSNGEYFEPCGYYGDLNVDSIIGLEISFSDDITKVDVNLGTAFSQEAMNAANHTLYANLTVDMRCVYCRVCDRLSYLLWCAKNDQVYYTYEQLEYDNIVENEETLLIALADGESKEYFHKRRS